MAKFSAGSIILLLVCAVAARSIEDHLRNMDTMDYLHMDCNHHMFNSYVRSNENCTVYVNLCRMLPESTIQEAKLPAEVKVVPSNIIIKREIMGQPVYTFLNLSTNNGIILSSTKGPHAKVYWKVPLLNGLFIDLALELTYKLKTPEVMTVSISDAYPQVDPHDKTRRFPSSSSIQMSYYKKDAAVVMDGVYYFSTTKIIIELAFYTVIGLILLLPREVILVGNRYSMQDALLYWLAINFLTDMVVQYFGEFLPIANFIVLMTLPTIMCILLVSKPLMDRINVRQNAIYFFISMLVFNYLIVSVFVWTTMFRNHQYILPSVYTIVLPLVCRFVFKLGTSDESFRKLSLPFYVGMFLFLRVFQVFERIRGMLVRSVASPLMGPFYTQVCYFLPLMTAVILYQALFLILLKFMPTNDLKIDDKYMSGVDDVTDNSASKF